VKMRARPPVQRNGTRSQKVTGNVGDRERSDLVIVGESKSEKVGRLSRGFPSVDEWQDGSRCRVRRA